MKVEIWHLGTSPDTTGQYVKGQTIELVSVSDETTCQLAFMHTNEGSIPNLQGQGVTTAEGDVYVLFDEGSADYRSYCISFDDLNQPVFEACDFSRSTGHGHN